MTEDEHPIVGEYCVALETIAGFEKGKLYNCVYEEKDNYNHLFIKSLSYHREPAGTPNGWSKKYFANHWRKASLEEIRDWFSNTSSKNEDPLPIRFELKKGIDRQAFVPNFQYDSVFHHVYKQTGVLDLVYNPVFPEKEIVITVPSSSGDFDVVITKGVVKSEDGAVDIQGLTNVIIGTTPLEKVGPWLVTYKTVDIGCKKDIPISALEKILEEYNKLNA